MANQEKTSQIDDIITHIQNLRKQGEESDVKVKTLIEKRNQLNDQVKKILLEINAIKTERDTLNEQVKTLKQQRDEVRVSVTPINEEINGVRNKIDELKKKLPRERQQDLKKELEAIEWKIQTTSLDLQEEKRLIGNVKELEILLSGYKKIETQNKKIRGLLEKRKVFEVQANALHTELTNTAKKSQDLHANMMEKLNAMKSIKGEADAVHQEYIKTKDGIVPLYVQIGELVGQMRALKAERKQENEVRKLAAMQAMKEQHESMKERRQFDNERQNALKEKQQAIKEKLGAQARDKLQKGEKISWDEFQLSMSDEDEESEKQKG